MPSCRTPVATLVLVLILAPAQALWHQVSGNAAEVALHIMHQSASRTVLEVTVPGIEVTRETVGDREFSRLAIPGARPAGLETGRPDVPRISVLLAVPPGAKVDVAVVTLDSAVLRVADIYPAQPPRKESEVTPPFECNEAAYQEDASYPSSSAVVAHTGTWRDLTVVDIDLYPVQVRSARGEVIVASRVRVELDYSGVAGT